MKKILIILAAIFLVFIGAIIIFALTFDVNRYKGIIIEKLRQTIQKDIALERLSLDFSHGLGCRVDGLALKEKDARWDDAWLKARNAQISVKILPLFKKDVQVNRIDIEGLDLQLTSELLKQPAQSSDSSQGKSDASTMALGALKFLAKVIVIKDSIITYMPTKSEDMIKIGISTLMLNNVSLSGPVHVNAILSTLDKGKDNIIVKGVVFPELSNKTPYIKDLDLKIDVSGIDIPGFLRTFGYKQIAEQLIDKKVRGIVIIRADKLLLDPNKIFDSNVSLKLSEFETDVLPLKGGVKNLTVDIELSGKGLIIKNCFGVVAGGNISASGTIKDIEAVVSQKGMLETENVLVQFNLQDFNVSELVAMSGNEDIAKTLKEKTIEGKVTIKSDKFSLGQKEKSSGLSILLSQGMTDIIPIQGGVKDIELDAVLEQNNLLVHKLTGSAAGGTFLIQGSVNNIFSSQISNFDISCSGINLDSLLLQTIPEAPRFKGIADLKATITGQGFQQDQLMQSLTGLGSLKVDKPVLKNMNILRMAFDKMDMIPGLVARLRENLPENYTEVLKQNDTNFKPMDVAYTISQGKLIFKDVSIESDGFLVKAQGEAGLLGDIQIGSYLFIAPDLSLAFIKIVRELRFLANEQGMINMPLSITGKAPQVSVNIDRDYVLRKLIVSKGSELLENIFKKKDKSQEEPRSQPGETQQDTDSSNVQQKKSRSSEPAVLIKSIFDIIGSQDK